MVFAFGWRKKKLLRYRFASNLLLSLLSIYFCFLKRIRKVFAELKGRKPFIRKRIVTRIPNNTYDKQTERILFYNCETIWQIL